MRVKIEGLDSGAWDLAHDGASTTRQFLRLVPFFECRRFASVGDSAAPAALVAAASFAEHATAFALSPPAADRLSRSAAKNRLTNCQITGNELLQSPDLFDMIVARGLPTKDVFTHILARLAPGGRIFVQY